MLFYFVDIFILAYMIWYLLLWTYALFVCLFFVHELCVLFFSFSFYAPGTLLSAPNIDIIGNGEERERGIEFGTGLPLVAQNIILKFFEKEKEREESDNIIKGCEIKGATAPNATNFNYDFGFERERGEGIGFGTGILLATTSGMVLKFCEKKSEWLKYGALSLAPATATGIWYEQGLFKYNSEPLFATHIGEFPAPLGAFFTTFNGDIEAFFEALPGAFGATNIGDTGFTFKALTGLVLATNNQIQ